MTEELRAGLQRLADANKRTLSDYIRLLLEEHVEENREHGHGERHGTHRGVGG